MVEIKWFHVTRALGIFVFLYGLLVDDSPERGTIILIGAGAAGFDKVARSSDPPPSKPPTSEADPKKEVK